MQQALKGRRKLRSETTRSRKLIARAKKEGWRGIRFKEMLTWKEMKTQGLNNRRTVNVERGRKKTGKCNTAAMKEREIQH